jgi:hypothetical protein
MRQRSFLRIDLIRSLEILWSFLGCSGRGHSGSPRCEATALGTCQRLQALCRREAEVGSIGSNFSRSGWLVRRDCNEYIEFQKYVIIAQS